MALRRRAKITVELGELGYTASKYFIGTEDEVYEEGHDWMHEVALRFIDEEDIDDPDEQDLVIESASHMIEWDNSDYLVMYAVCPSDVAGAPEGVFLTVADAEEYIIGAAEDFAYECLMTDDPYEVVGRPWEYDYDYDWLVRDYCNSVTIEEVQVFDVIERE